MVHTKPTYVVNTKPTYVVQAKPSYVMPTKPSYVVPMQPTDVVPTKPAYVVVPTNPTYIVLIQPTYVVPTCATCHGPHKDPRQCRVLVDWNQPQFSVAVESSDSLMFPTVNNLQPKFRCKTSKHSQDLDLYIVFYTNCSTGKNKSSLDNYIVELQVKLNLNYIIDLSLYCRCLYNDKCFGKAKK